MNFKFMLFLFKRFIINLIRIGYLVFKKFKMFNCKYMMIDENDLC